MIRNVASDWEGAVLVCGKCTRKLGGGFGGKRRTPLLKLLRKHVAGAGRKRKATLGIVEGKCFGLCPKNAVVVVDTTRPHQWLVVQAGEPIETVAARLGRPLDEAPAQT